MKRNARNAFVERRLRQLVREEFELVDWQEFVRQVIRKELYGHDRPAEQARPKLKVVKSCP